MKACFMGLGYIGLPTAIIAAKHGIQIIGVDIKVSSINSIYPLVSDSRTL